MSKQSIEQAVQEGLRQGRHELDATSRAAESRRQTERNNLEASFNVASGVIEGLKALQEMPGSKFKFDPRPQGDRVYISTNIPVQSDHNDHATLAIIAEANGRIFAYGDEARDHSGHAVSVTNTDPGAPEKVTTFIAKAAARRGLVP